MKLHHVQILCPPDGEPGARAFYRDLLGLREIPKPSTLSPQGVWFELDDCCQLHVGVARRGDTLAASRAHFALQVDDLDRLTGRLSTAGIDYVEKNDVEGWRRIHLRDPFNNAIELLQIQHD